MAADSGWKHNGTMNRDDPPQRAADPHATTDVNTAAGAFSTKVTPDVTSGSANFHADTAVGRTFGDYELLSEIAAGGMGVVFRARQMRLNRLVALKMIRSGELAGPEQIQRFRAEAEAAAQLEHPNIVPVYQVGEVAGQHFFTMGLVEGPSLWQVVKESPLDPREAARIIKLSAEAVHFAHTKGIVHRDLKPQNILLAADGQPKVTDFGLAKSSTLDSSLTATGQILGTPSYMPPEQAAGRMKQVGVQADVYSLGATLYCLLTGRPPFQAASTLETLKLVLEQEPVPLRALNSRVQRDLETICMKCLEKEPERRYASAAALAADLDAVLRGEAISIRGSDMFDQLFRMLKRNRDDVELRAWGVILQAFAAIVLATEIWVWFVSQMAEPRRTIAMLIGRGFELAAMALACWWQRQAFRNGQTAATRQMWTHWIAFLLACHTIAGVMVGYLWMFEPSSRLTILMAYPYFSVASGMTWFTLGSNFWGYCYLIGAAFFALALVMPFTITWAPLEFGLLWGATLWITARRLKQLSVE